MVGDGRGRRALTQFSLSQWWIWLPASRLSRQSARPARWVGESGPGAEGQYEWGGKGGQQETQPLGDGKSGTRLVSIAQGELRIGRPGSWLLKNRGRLLILHHPIGSFLRTVSN